LASHYLVPRIARERGLSQQLLGPIFSSALAGLMVGYLVLSPLSDRFGHKRVLVAATVSFALCTLAAVRSGTVTELVVLRFLTGLGSAGRWASAASAALPARCSPVRRSGPAGVRARCLRHVDAHARRRAGGVGAR
jgi:AAHS family 4-hydroxybenzoate transporter-like MFS transporter